MFKEKNAVSATSPPSVWVRLAFLAPLPRLWIRLVHDARNRLTQPDVSGLSDRMLRDIGLDHTGADRLSDRPIMPHHRGDLRDIDPWH